jgi:hypothetical protein
MKHKRELTFPHLESHSCGAYSIYMHSFMYNIVRKKILSELERDRAMYNILNCDSYTLCLLVLQKAFLTISESPKFTKLFAITAANCRALTHCTYVFYSEGHEQAERCCSRCRSLESESV